MLIPVPGNSTITIYRISCKVCTTTDNIVDYLGTAKPTHAVEVLPAFSGIKFPQNLQTN